MPFGQVFATLFFVLLTIAALTSSVSLLEVVVSYFVDEHQVPRGRASTLFGFCSSSSIGVPSVALPRACGAALSIGEKTMFGFVDYVVTHLMLPIGGFFIAIFVGWVIYPKAAAELDKPWRAPVSPDAVLGFHLPLSGAGRDLLDPGKWPLEQLRPMITRSP